MGANNVGIIGAPFSAQVQSINGSPKFQQVVWQVTGAVKSETYVNSMGSFTPLGSVIDKFVAPNQPSTDYLGSFWGNTPGTYTITATATFSDGVTKSGSVTVDVIAPAVESFTVTATPWAWQPDQTNHIGFTCQTPFTMAATVSVPDSAGAANYGGEIGLIQKINRTYTVTNSISGPHVIDTSGFVLDTVGTAVDPSGSDYLYPGSRTKISNATTASFSCSDQPNTLWHWGVDKATGQNDLALNLKETTTLEDHLVFRPDGGIWVNLATASPIVTTGEESYNVNTGEWSVVAAPTPNSTSVMPTHQDYNIVTWTNWYGNPAITWNPVYNY